MLDLDANSDVHVISVHDEEEPIHFSVPSVVPSRYDIPGVNAPVEAFKACKFALPGLNQPFQYAIRRTKNNVPYVLIKIVAAKTFIYGTEAQKMDEHGQKLSPDVMRVPIPVELERIANEIERAHGKMGIMAIKGEVTEAHLQECKRRSIAFMRESVAETNRWEKKNPANITSQARRRAWTLHKMGLLNPLPGWAEINPDAKSGDNNGMFNCVNCGKMVRAKTIKCDCGAVYDWKAAVDNGLVKPVDVPPSKRKEAGLADEMGVPERATPLMAPISDAPPLSDEEIEILKGQNDAANASEYWGASSKGLGPQGFEEPETLTETSTEELVEQSRRDGNAPVVEP